MKHFLPILFIFSFNLVSPLLAQDKKCANMSALLENKIWKVQLPKDKQYAMEMEFRSAGWRTTFLYDEKQTKTFYSYSLHGDTIKVFESGKNYIIQELTDSTLTFLYLPESLKSELRLSDVQQITVFKGNERTKNVWIVFGAKKIFGTRVLLLSIKLRLSKNIPDGLYGIMTWKSISFLK